MKKSRLYRYAEIDLKDHVEQIDVNTRAEEAGHSFGVLTCVVVMVWSWLQTGSFLQTLGVVVLWILLISAVLVVVFGPTPCLIEDNDALGGVRYWLVAGGHRSEVSYLEVPYYQRKTIFAHTIT